MAIKVIVEKKQYKKKFYDKKEEIAKALEEKGYDNDAAFSMADSKAKDAGYKELKEEELDQLDERSRKKRKKARKRRKKKKKKGKKDACYHKVRARYDVWPSAYASGALVKCRKVGAANWGNKSKKTNEELISDIENLLEEADFIIEEATSGDLNNQVASFDEWYAQVQKYLASEIQSGLFDPKKEYDGAYRAYVDGYITSDYEEEWLASKNLLEKKRKKKRKKRRKKKSKLTSKPSSEKSLHHWFSRKGAKGKKKGWVDCNAPDGKGGYKSCGRSSGEKRKRYPACRPTPGACKKMKGSKGKSWGKKGSKKK